jgi:hypothetical protein
VLRKSSDNCWLSTVSSGGSGRSTPEHILVLWEREYEVMVNHFITKVSHYADEWLESPAGVTIRKKIAEYKYHPN